jgi:ABC-type amino acid transport system permease subunit
VTSVVWAKLGATSSSCGPNTASTYLGGMGRTLALALIATFIGCLIGFLCGILQTIPCAKTDNRRVKRFCSASCG